MKPTDDQIREFCDWWRVSFYRWGRPDDWSDHTFFRVSTHEFPARGLTFPIESLLSFIRNPPFVAESI